MSQNPNDINNFFNFGLYFKSRTIYIGSEENDSQEIDYKTTEQVIKGLHILDGYDKDINIILNNIGGDDYHGLAVYDAICSCNNRVNITVYGQAMSMASIIFQAGDKRIMMPSSVLMVHVGEEFVHGHPKNNRNWIKEWDRNTQYVENIYLDKIKEKLPKFTRAQLKKLLDFDTILTAEQAVEAGLADEVWSEE